jgi:hypothetical protein
MIAPRQTMDLPTDLGLATEQTVVLGETIATDTLSPRTIVIMQLPQPAP